MSEGDEKLRSVMSSTMKKSWRIESQKPQGPREAVGLWQLRREGGRREQERGAIVQLGLRKLQGCISKDGVMGSGEEGQSQP